ncbi:RfaG Glycosyltransferase [Candidatus Methylopumilus universalis]|uniref:glycosyltransferase n=1 Tax=Candidatus Methylopumilus universalis TaxID=2588536 RepID=UPI003BEEC8E2
MILDMSFILSVFNDRKLDEALRSRKLNGFFSSVISVHPLAGLFYQGLDKFGAPRISLVDKEHIFIEGKIGVSKFLSWLPFLNLLLAQIHLFCILLRTAKTMKVEIIRIGDPYYLGIMGLLLSWFLKVPLVIRACFNYDLIYTTTKKPVFPRLFRFRVIEKFVERFVFPHCDIIAGANKNNLDYAIENGAPADRGVVFRYGNLIHPIHFSSPKKRGSVLKIYRDLRISEPFLMTISRLEKMKQPEDNLFVLRKLHDAGKKVFFIFVGDGSLRDELKILSEELGLSNYVRFAGNRDQVWIAKILPHAEIVLSPHMGRGLTEACLAGAPIVAYNYDWQEEIIISGETGELVTNGNWNEMAIKALSLYENPKRRKKLGRYARKIAMEMMNPEKLNDYEIKVYNKLLKKKF